METNISSGFRFYAFVMLLLWIFGRKKTQIIEEIMTTLPPVQRKFPLINDAWRVGERED